MAAYNFALLTDLRAKPVFRTSVGRSFTEPFRLADGIDARISVQGFGYADGPHLIRVVDHDQRLLGEASIVSNTAQVFRALGVLVHFTIGAH